MPGRNMPAAFYGADPRTRVPGALQRLCRDEDVSSFISIRAPTRRTLPAIGLQKRRAGRYEMRIYRIYADSELHAGAELVLSERAARHLVKVLRHRVGDRVRLFDGKGREAVAEIITTHRRHGCSVRVIATVEISRESPLEIELLPGLSRGDKMDLVIQKAAELGVAAIRPVITERSEVRPDKSTASRLSRWHEIVIGACEQSGRAHLPRIHAPIAIDEMTASASTRLVLDPESTTGLADCRPADNRISIAIGPEGGLSKQDLALFGHKGFRSVMFGPRILRTETAGIAAIAAVQVLYGDLGCRAT